MIRFLLTLFMLVTFSVCVKAEWIYQLEENPFEGDQHIGVAIEYSGYMAGFRCSGPDDLELVFVTPEKAEGSQETRLLQALPQSLLVVVDGAEKLEFEAKLDVTPDGEKYRLTASGDGLVDLIFATSGAKRRFAVAQEAFGKVGHSKTFSAGGSSRVLKRLIEGCKLKEPT